MGKDDLRIGEKQSDGSTYAGISEETGEKLFIMGVEKLAGLGNPDQLNKDLTARGLRLPTRKELPAVMKALNIAAGGEKKPDTKGTSNETGSNPAVWHWSSSQSAGGLAWDQRFNGGDQNVSRDYSSGSKANDQQEFAALVKVVRPEPGSPS